MKLEDKLNKFMISIQYKLTIGITVSEIKQDFIKNFSHEKQYLLDDPSLLKEDSTKNALLIDDFIQSHTRMVEEYSVKMKENTQPLL